MTERNKFTVQSLFNQPAEFLLTEDGIISNMTVNKKPLQTCNINYEERELPVSIKAGDLITLPDGEVEYSFDTTSATSDDNSSNQIL